MSVDPNQPYDDTNVFARILRGDIACNKIHETPWALSFYDLNPQAPVHALVIPKGRYVSLVDFSAAAPSDLIAGFWRAVGETATALGLPPTGYRVLINTGLHAHQEVPHLHAHILAGRPLGPMLAHLEV